jgi:hypothetical protein
MINKTFIRVMVLTIVLSLIAIQASALDYPHSGANIITCDSCHFIYGGEPSLLPPWTSHVPQDIDDTQYNMLCWSCHNGLDVLSFVRTHSSLTTDNSYGNWSIECRTCHNPHKQEQFKTYGSASYLYEGTISSVSATTLTESGAGWTPDEYEGLILVPNVAKVSYNYQITGNTSDTLTVKGAIDTARVSTGNTFAIVYGKLIKDTIRLDDITTYIGVSTDIPDVNTIVETGEGWTDNQYQGLEVIPNASQPSYKYKITSNTSDTLTVQGPMDLAYIDIGDIFKIVAVKTGDRTVRFFDSTGTNSFADGIGQYDGICEACHTQTEHFQNEGGGTDQLHANVGGAGGENCITCHSHVNGFAHISDGGGSGCEECHGHDPGYGGYTGGKGTYVSHSTHTENDADDLKGPNVGCTQCHETDGFPYFKSGTDGNGDGKYSLSETDVCDTCHSSGGTYNGISDAALGVKNNWDSGVYDGDSLKAGKEKWCVTCHDEVPSQIQSINAPNVVGDEDGAYTYGTGWGYYKTGHGLNGQTYPASGGLVPGAGKECNICHDYSLAHVDGLARTFDCSDGCNSTEYRQSYRLKLVNGLNPLRVPRDPNPVIADDFRLCLQGGCHNSDKYIKSNMLITNFRDETDFDYPAGAAIPVNQHAFHLGLSGTGKFYADWGVNTNSHPTCIACHNVHGSTQLAMIRDGKLVNKEPGMVMYYIQNGVSTINPYPNPPTPLITLENSDATIFSPAGVSNLCFSCHWAGGYYKYDRTPPGPQQVPTLSWTGEANYTSDGIHPDSSPGGGYFVFRVDYTDANYEPPKYMQVWIDENDNATYESGEKYDMMAVDPTDLDFSDGKLYQKTLAIQKAGDGSLNYRFYADDGKDAATGAPASDSVVTLTNNTPTLAWTGEVNYMGDGVDPNSGAGGSNFVFQIKYTDADNETPGPIQVWVDENDNGSYDAGEKHVMTEVDAGDSDHTDGKLYTRTLAIAYVVDGTFKYRFYAYDGTDDATGTPVSDSFVTVTSLNNAPVLAWTGETEYTIDGVDPDSGAGCIDFEFRVSYTDDENDAPSFIQIWVDRNDDGVRFRRNS